jgi:uncharacterized RDD family membrane protein YckC
LQDAPLRRRLISLVYEACALTAVLWLAGFGLGLVENAVGLTHSRLAFQVYLVGVAGLYFVWQWRRGGQTLPMKTWRLKLVSNDDRALRPRQAIVRYVAALAGSALFGAGFLWALVDRDRRFLHDRIARTKIVRAMLSGNDTEGNQGFPP